jgi:hypothetical protein
LEKLKISLKAIKGEEEKLKKGSRFQAGGSKGEEEAVV